jgi:hypothetical protein
MTTTILRDPGTSRILVSPCLDQQLKARARLPDSPLPSCAARPQRGPLLCGTGRSDGSGGLGAGQCWGRREPAIRLDFMGICDLRDSLQIRETLSVLAMPQDLKEQIVIEAARLQAKVVQENARNNSDLEQLWAGIESGKQEQQRKMSELRGQIQQPEQMLKVLTETLLGGSVRAASLQDTLTQLQGRLEGMRQAILKQRIELEEAQVSRLPHRQIVFAADVPWDRMAATITPSSSELRMQGAKIQFAEYLELQDGQVTEYERSQSMYQALGIRKLWVLLRAEDDGSFTMDLYAQMEVGQKTTPSEVTKRSGSGSLTKPVTKPTTSVKPADQPTSGTFTDSRDKQTYRWVRLADGRNWMAENLTFLAGNSWCYGKDPANCTGYGRLCTWETALNVCPGGWGLPSKADFDALLQAYGGEG